MTQYWRHIEAYWHHVTPEDKAAGVAAYPAYHEMMRRIAVKYLVDQTNVTEAFAALSPNSDYLGNLRSLVSVLDGIKYDQPWTISTYRACGHRAETYLRGTVDFMTTVKGRKIRAFRNCIVSPDTCTDFVLDGHMIAIALGKSMTMKEAQFALGNRYSAIEAAYVRFARRKWLSAPQLQATLWYCRKRREGIKFTTQRDFWRDDARLLYPVDEVLPYPNKDEQSA